jgi:hypothetical protein
MGERMMTWVFHSAFLSVGLWQLRRRFIVGFAGAVLPHWLTNFPVFLMAWIVGVIDWCLVIRILYGM